MILELFLNYRDKFQEILKSAINTLKLIISKISYI